VVKRMTGVWESVQGSTISSQSEEELAAESEVLQKVTDYSTGELSTKVTLHIKVCLAHCSHTRPLGSFAMDGINSDVR
jgi:hypothetical protein